MFTKDMPIVQSFIKPFHEGFGGIGVNLNVFNHPSTCHLGVRNEVVLDNVFKLGFAPLL